MHKAIDLFPSQNSVTYYIVLAVVLCKKYLKNIKYAENLLYENPNRLFLVQEKHL